MASGKKLISLVSPCFNEGENVDELCRRIKAQMESLPQYDWEHILIDNASVDDTVLRIKAIARADKRVKLIVNCRNFGHLRSPMHAIFQSKGDAIIFLASDLQDPPELIPDFIRKWEEGYKVAIGVKPTTKDGLLMRMARGAYYKTIGKISDVKQIPNFTGFGLYDRVVIDRVRRLDDPYPYFRGLIAEFGYEYATITFHQPPRVRGITTNNAYSLYDFAMLGLTSHSKVPIRLATFAGFSLSGLSMLIALGYLIAKLAFWDSFAFGMAPVLIGMFFFASVQLFFIGIIGEYIASIHTHVKKRPLVIEKERINFDAGNANDQQDDHDPR